jgi:TPR repeat protein
MLKVGPEYARGGGVREDHEMARRYYEKAAEAGSAEAMFRLAAIHLTLEELGHDAAKALQAPRSPKALKQFLKGYGPWVRACSNQSLWF